MFNLLRRYEIFALFAVAIVAALISFPNHFAFRTYALDLGLYTHIAWGYLSAFTSGFQMVGITRHPLADHFDLYLILLAPIAGLLGAFGLLLAQWLSVMYASLTINKIGQFTDHRWLFIIYFLALWPLSNALAYDYHSVTISAMLWLGWWYASNNGRWSVSWLFLIFIWIGKENMPLWMAFSASGFAFLHPQYRKQALLQSAFSAVAFLLIIGIIMPYFSVGEVVSNLGKYSLLGSSFEEVIKSISQPANLIEALFHSRANGLLDTGDVKIEFWIFFALSGGWLLIRKPAYLWMVIPIILQKMWHDNERFGGIIAHYSIELLPVMLIAAVDFFKSIPNKKLFVSILIVPALLVTFRSMDRPVDRSNQAQIRFYKTTHYYRDGQAETHRLLAELPQLASISAMSPMVPHLACRPYIFEYPIHSDDADYIVILKTEQCYPISCEERDEDLQLLRENIRYEIVGETNMVAIFHRK